MASKSKKKVSKNTSSNGANVTRIKAQDSVKTAAKEVESVTIKTANKDSESIERKTSRNPLKALWNYFKGAWVELRQVRWPNRRATWSLTGAVIVFSLFFVVLILLLDILFKYLFELILV